MRGRAKNRRRTSRRLGRDRRTPLAPVGPAASPLTVGNGRLAIAATIVAWSAYAVPTIWAEFVGPGGWSLGRFAESTAYVVFISLLALSATAYLLARHGALVRSRRHRRAPRGLIDAAMADCVDRTLTVLVPSYREDARVIRQTLLSAALQEYPHKRVVLLIDDPPTPDSPEAERILDEARRLPGEIAELLAPAAADADRAATTWDQERPTTPEAIAACAEAFRSGARHVQTWREGFEVTDHTDRFCRDEVLGGLQRDLDEVADALDIATERDGSVPEDTLGQLYRRLRWTFACELTSFERKRYINLSHDANKAMNLNSYIGLMGGVYREEGRGSSLALAECSPEVGDTLIPDTDYILTLDADSVLLPEYCLRLTHRLEQPAFRDVAVIQTPYSAYPGAGSRIERIAGATTDVQHILHQGMTYYDATFWVGANAILRRDALVDIAEVDNSGPWPVTRYISDRTVIEDTESSIDLVAQGWRLHNYQERLSYSATPPDFGALCIQRERWANGGLLILRKLRLRSGLGTEPLGTLLRLNYMGSIAWASLGLLFMLLYPFDDRLLSPLVAAMALPYFAAMASDLKRAGYKRTDVVRIYAFNLLMLPVNLTGSIKSIYQAVSGRKFSFARTPKVKRRTTAPFWFAAFPYLLIGWSAWTTYRDIQEAAWGHAVFAGLNCLLCAYGLVAFIGVRNSLVDMTLRAFDMLRQDERAITEPTTAAERWEEVLFYGNDGTDDDSGSKVPSTLARSRPEHFAPPEEQVPASVPAGVRSPRAGRSVPAAAPPTDDLIEALRASRELLAAIERRLDAHESAEVRAQGSHRADQPTDPTTVEARS